MPELPKNQLYFLNIESDLVRCARYVDFSEANYKTYSNEFAKIIVLAASEIDSIFRELCKAISPKTKANNILEYRPILLSVFPNFLKCEVDLPRYKIRLAPWTEWEEDSSPSWWGKGFNKLKHERYENFKQANLKNALCSVGSLFLCILHYHQYFCEETVAVDLSLRSSLFEVASEGNYGGTFWSHGGEFYQTKNSCDSQPALHRTAGGSALLFPQFPPCGRRPLS